MLNAARVNRFSKWAGKLKYLSLQYLRGVAAYCVVLFHADYYIRSSRGDISDLNAFANGFGTFGVFIFFALSGFLMSVQTRKSEITFSNFLIHRIIRIYPTFWLICLAKIVLGWPFGIFAQFDPLILMLAPVGQRNYILGVEWTLVYEVCFYLFISLLILCRVHRFVSYIALAWLGLLVLDSTLYSGYSPQFLTDIFSLPQSSTCTAFAAGLLIPALLQHKLVRQSALPIGAFSLALGRVTYFASFQNILAGLGCAAIVAWGATLVDDSDTRSPVLAKLGDWSFATYLVHVPIITTTLIAISSTYAVSTIWSVSIGTVVIVSSAIGLADVWLYQWLKAWADSRRAWTRTAVCVGFLCLFFGSMLVSRKDFLDATSVPSGLERLSQASTSDEVASFMLNAGYGVDDRLVGSLDGLARQKDSLMAAGWVNNPRNLLNRAKVLILIPGALPKSLVPTDYRGDVINAYGLWRFLAPTAFQREIRGASCPEGKQVLVVAVSEASKGYRELTPSVCPPNK